MRISARTLYLAGPVSGQLRKRSGGPGLQQKARRLPKFRRARSSTLYATIAVDLQARRGTRLRWSNRSLHLAIGRIDKIGNAGRIGAPHSRLVPDITQS